MVTSGKKDKYGKEYDDDKDDYGQKAETTTSSTAATAMTT